MHVACSSVVQQQAAMGGGMEADDVQLHAQEGAE
jgi:hypothetical protein